MRILLLHQYFLKNGQGGGQRFNEFVKYWADQNVHIDVITGSNHYLKDNEGNDSFFELDNYYKNVRVWRCRVSRWYYKGFFGRLLGYGSYFFSSLYVLIFKTEKKYDVIIASSPPISIMFTGLIARFVKSGKLVFELRDLWPGAAVDLNVLRSSLLIRLLKGLEKYFYEKSDFINVLSPDFRKYLVDEFQIKEAKIWFIPNGGRAGVELRREINKVFTVVYAGAMSLVNDVSELLVVAKETPSIKYVLVGDGNEKSKLLKIAEKEQLTNVHFISLLSYEETLIEIGKADIGVVTYKEGQFLNKNFTNKMFDYMSCGKPVLLSLPGASKEFIEKNSCGIWLDKNKIHDWANLLNKLQASPDLCKDLGSNGYALINQQYNREMLASEYLTLLS